MRENVFLMCSINTRSHIRPTAIPELTRVLNIKLFVIKLLLAMCDRREGQSARLRRTVAHRGVRTESAKFIPSENRQDIKCGDISDLMTVAIDIN